MSKELNWETFIEECFNDDRITVQETNEEKSFITIENVKNTDPAALAMLYALAQDCGVYVGATYVDECNTYDGTVTFYP